jgi:uncharacterized membrane protein YbjE (DUF340 family)
MLASVFLGVFFTQFNFTPDILIKNSEILTEYSLFLMLILIGYDMGRDKESLKKLLNTDRRAFLLPLGTVVGTLVGGYIASFVINLSAKDSMAIASGFGWYSLSAIIIADAKGTDLGSIAFLTNVSRELFSIILIPFVVKYIGPYVAIAPGGATTMDTTLPLIEKYAGESAAVIAFIHGFILSALVPFCVSLFL